MSFLAANHFAPVRSRRIHTLNVDVQEYLHERTGASHFHISAEDSNNAFMVAFRTMPEDSSGVAHILEHTTLCGSRRFPVRDPFFMMLRRSLNTFMNAFTGADMTAYPFATQNRKDFDNLLQVYLDATFFPLLDELDFSQEGHRVEFKDPEDLDSGLEFKGVVYNEMKGALSSPTAQLWNALQSTLFPDTTYHFNSGGDPSAIPDLTYEQLKQFHRSHYQPSNAIFMTYGDFPVDQHQANIEQWALREFEGKDVPLSVPDVKRYKTPVKHDIRYAVATEEEVESSSHVVLAWLLGRVTDLDDLMEAYLLSSVLLENSASPLLQALETTELGSAPSELCGIETSFREILICCGLEGCTVDAGAAVEDMIMRVIAEVAENGVAAGQLDAAVHRLELAQREIAATDPYGLQLMWRMLPSVIHGGDPFSVLDIDHALAKLREAVREPDYIKHLVKRLLIDNTHCVRISMNPDLMLGAQLEGAVQTELQRIEESMSRADKLDLVERARQLDDRQRSEDDPDVLPRISLSDIPGEVKCVEGRCGSVGGLPTTSFSAGTNGLVHEQIVLDLPALSTKELAVLPLYCDFLTELGSGGDDYLAMQRRRALIGSTRSSVSIRGEVRDPQRIRAFFTLSGKGLGKDHAVLAELLRDTLCNARFDELRRIRELLAQYRAAEEASITERGHVLAMLAAQSGMSVGGYIDALQDGPEFIYDLKRRDDAADSVENLTELCERLNSIHQKLLRALPRLLIVSEASQHDSFERDLANCWRSVGRETYDVGRLELSPVDFTVRQAWFTNTQVQFCARAFPCVPAAHADAAALIVLGGYLREGFLHREIREHGGAYGAGAGYNADAGAFRFFSYRDPRLKETLADFGRSLDWLHGEQPASRLEEAVLGVIRSQDAPSSPAHEAIQAYFGGLQGRTPEFRQELRERVLAVTLDDLRRVADSYLKPERASTAVITRRELRSICDDLELEGSEI